MTKSTKSQKMKDIKKTLASFIEANKINDIETVAILNSFCEYIDEKSENIDKAKLYYDINDKKDMEKFIRDINKIEKIYEVKKNKNIIELVYKPVGEIIEKEEETGWIDDPENGSGPTTCFVKRDKLKGIVDVQEGHWYTDKMIW